MKTIVYGLSAVALALLAAGCGYSERTYAVQAPAAAVAVPGGTYYGDRYYSSPYYYPTTTAYVRYY
jgi:hypothetical protein